MPISECGAQFAALLLVAQSPDRICFSFCRTETMASPAKENNYRMKSYKNKALNPEEMRRRREEEGIQLRKQKREQQVMCA